ncbi:MAG: hypothetical protein ACLFUH_01760 [Bacteroidales bacterium]
MKPLIFILLTLLIGCTVYDSSWNDPQYKDKDNKAKQTVKVEFDEFSGETKIVGIKERGKVNYVKYLTFIRSFIKDDQITHQLYVILEYRNDWRFYNRSNGQDKRKLETVNIERDVDCYNFCEYVEHLGIYIDESILEKYQDKGYKIKMYAKSGHETVINFTSEQIDRHLKKISELKKDTGV